MDSKKNKTMITGIQLVEHLCSQGYYIEEQREFGIKDIGRSIKKLIPKIKNKIDETYANSPLGKWEINKRRGSIRKSLSKRNRLMKEIERDDSKSIFQNSEIESKLLNKSKDNKKLSYYRKNFL